MLYSLLDWLFHGDTNYAYGEPLFRAAIAMIFAFLVVWALAPRVIMTLVKMKIGDQANFNHEKLNEITKVKQNTPTMGGVLIVIAIFVSVIMLANLSNYYIRMALFCLVWLAILGGVDDYLKLTAARRSDGRDGLKMWEKLVFQFALGALLAVFVFKHGQDASESLRMTDLESDYHPFNVLSIPFYKGQPLGAYHGVMIPVSLFAIIAILVIAGTSNAVNLTDGMDGLASGCMVLTAVVFAALATIVGDKNLCRDLLFFHVPEADELAVLCGAVAGACGGFLWFNAYPARVFMGDTGSLPLGGLIGYIAIVTRLELMLFLVGGIFVIEAISVVIQIFYFKSTGGKRFFRCAPLHHHFHLGGASETQVVMRFWLVALIFAVFALATIKLR